MSNTLILLLAIGLAAATPVRAQESSAWVVTLGADTLSLEQFTRTALQVRGEMVTRTPRSLHRSYVMDLNPDGTVRKLELVTRELRPTPGPIETRSSIDFTRDTAIVVIPRGDTTVTFRVPAGKGAVPSINGVMGFMDQLGHQSRAAGVASYPTAMVGLSPTAFRGTTSPGGGDTLWLNVVTPVGAVPPFMLRTERDGRLVAFSGKGSVFQAVGVKVPAVDLAGAAALFAQRPIGQLSSRDTARATVGDAEVWIDFGRPLKRGREILGSLVPWNAVWRTGANAATQIRTSQDLVIGGAKVPAGIYSLWTLPSPKGWKLIINKQSGQWGTQYDAAMDLARVDMSVAQTAEPVDRFAMGIDAADAKGTIWLSWDRTRASVAIGR